MDGTAEIWWYNDLKYTTLIVYHPVYLAVCYMYLSSSF